MKGWTVTVWVDVPDDWDAKEVRQEITKRVRHTGPGWTRLHLNTVHTPKPEKGLDDE